ncbi:MAG TPA: flagellar motor switch protein FliG [Planctomycetota bacterium]|nr:flagellar motor switch protein FliG [Planctomycetota bacterium]
MTEDADDALELGAAPGAPGASLEHDDPRIFPSGARASRIDTVLDAPEDAPSEAPRPRTGAQASHGIVTRPQGAAASPQGVSGARKAAVFILALEEEVASVLLQGLSDEELGRITAEIASLGVVDRETVAAVTREFQELERLQSLVREGGIEHAVRLVRKSFPPDKARRVVQLLAAQRQELPFSFLEGLEVEAMIACLEEEHPQTLAVVLAHMTPVKAAAILERLPPPTRLDILERIAGLEGASAEALEHVQAALKKHLDAARFETLGDAGGVKAAAEILRAAGNEGTAILDDLRAGRPELADEIGKHLFVFDDLLELDDRALQAVLKEIDTRHLALSLKNAREELKAKIFNNLARRAGEILREEMEFLGPVRFMEVETARNAILQIVLRLEESGQLYISGRGREENRIVY